MLRILEKFIYFSSHIHSLIKYIMPSMLGMFSSSSHLSVSIFYIFQWYVWKSSFLLVSFIFAFLKTNDSNFALGKFWFWMQPMACTNMHIPVKRKWKKKCITKCKILQKQQPRKSMKTNLKLIFQAIFFFLHSSLHFNIQHIFRSMTNRASCRHSTLLPNDE